MIWSVAGRVTISRILQWLKEPIEKNLMIETKDYSSLCTQFTRVARLSPVPQKMVLTYVLRVPKGPFDPSGPVKHCTGVAYVELLHQWAGTWKSFVGDHPVEVVQGILV